MTCLICKFWRADPALANLGHCLRYPPQVVVEVDTLETNENEARYSAEVVGRQESVWPTSKFNDWCGEYVAKY